MKWGYRAELVLGIWIFLSPWILQFSSSSSALWSNVFSGALVALASLWGMYGGEDIPQNGKPHENR